MAAVHKQIRAGEWPDGVQRTSGEPDVLSDADVEDAEYDKLDDYGYDYEAEDDYGYDSGDDDGYEESEEYELPQRRGKKKKKSESKATVRKDTGSSNSTRILIIAAAGVLLILIVIGLRVGIGNAGGSGTSEAEAELWADYRKYNEEDNTEMKLSVLRRLEALNPNAKTPDGTTVTKLRTLVEQSKQEEEFTEDFMRRLGQ